MTLSVTLYAAPLVEQEDELLRLAMQQSLLEYQQDPANIASLQTLAESRQDADHDLQWYARLFLYTEPVFSMKSVDMTSRTLIFSNCDG